MAQKAGNIHRINIMPYFTNKQGVIPGTSIDDQPGWILVSDPPVVPEDKELVWLNWEWVVRYPKPESREGFVWKFNHTEFKTNNESNGWIEYAIVNTESQELSSNIEILL